MLSVSGLCPGLQASNNPGLFKIVSGCFGLPLGPYRLLFFRQIDIQLINLLKGN